MEINCIGDTCPIPVIKTKKALKEIGENGTISVLTDNIEAIENIEKMVKDMNCSYITGRDEANYVITITKGDGGRDAQKNKKTSNKTVIFVSSGKIGQGDDEHGNALLKSFLYTLMESDAPPEAVIFSNSGVKMAVEGSPSIDIINALIEKGIDIFCCGTSLHHYGLTESLKTGSALNMHEITKIMLSASRVITV